MVHNFVVHKFVYHRFVTGTGDYSIISVVGLWPQNYQKIESKYYKSWCDGGKVRDFLSHVPAAISCSARGRHRPL